MPMNDLTTMIENVVREKTFSLDAVQAIEEIRKKAAKLEADLETSRSETKNYGAQLSTAKAEIAEWSIRSSAIDARDKAVAEREKKITELEKTSAVAAAESSILRGVVDKVFANRTVRESILTDQPVAYTASGSTYPSTHYQQKRDNIERQEG